MKVMAINDAPTPLKGYYHNGVYHERAYYKGDVFEIYDSGENLELDTRLSNGNIRVGGYYLIIYHDRFQTTMYVDTDNFINLREHRERKLNELGI